LDEAALLDGCYVLETTVPAATMARQTVDERYRDLQQVERNFKTMKTDFLAVRPIFLRNGEQTKAHVFVAMLATLLFGVGKVSAELIALTEPSFLYIGIAIVAGFAATFALVKPKLNEVLPGVAIAIALIPPLAMVGVGIAKWDWALITNSFLLFALNVIGIVFASMITFSLMNFYVKRRVARETIKEEEEKLEEEKELAEYGEKQTENNDDKKIPMEAQQDDSDKLYGKTIDI